MYSTLCATTNKHERIVGWIKSIPYAKKAIIIIDTTIATATINSLNHKLNSMNGFD